MFQSRQRYLQLQRLSEPKAANETKILNMNQFKEYTLAQGEIYKVFVKKDDGATTVTFPSAISKIAGVNVSVDGSTDFQISAQRRILFQPGRAA